MRQQVNQAFDEIHRNDRTSLAAGRPRRRAAPLLAGVVAALLAAPGQAQQLGTRTGLPLPRFVSLKSDRVNLREGPSKDHQTTWVYQRAGLPVEVTAEFDIWLKIRDSEGAEGWVLHTLLSGRRTALVAPWKKAVTLPLYAEAKLDSDVVANLQPGVLAKVKSCDGTWCRIFGDGFDGLEPQTNLWGVYPGERVE
jgi:SH3-like domain-containing protein